MGLAGSLLLTTSSQHTWSAAAQLTPLCFPCTAEHAVCLPLLHSLHAWLWQHLPAKHQGFCQTSMPSPRSSIVSIAWGPLFSQEVQLWGCRFLKSRRHGWPGVPRTQQLRVQGCSPGAQAVPICTLCSVRGSHDYHEWWPTSCLSWGALRPVGVKLGLSDPHSPSRSKGNDTRTRTLQLPPAREPALISALKVRT